MDLNFHFNVLIAMIVAIQQYAKDIHYSCTGDDFYAKHLLADRIYKGFNGYLDDLKEICLLGHGWIPLSSKEYMKGAEEFIPDIEVGNDIINFLRMHNLIQGTLEHLEKFKEQPTSRGDDNLLDDISQDLQHKHGFLNLQLDNMSN